MKKLESIISIQKLFKKGVSAQKLPILFQYAKVKDIHSTDEVSYRGRKVIKVPAINTTWLLTSAFYKHISKISSFISDE